MFKLSGTAISWESRKQKTVVCPAQKPNMGLNEASKEAIRLKMI